jgi:hypothetical protein
MVAAKDITMIDDRHWPKIFFFAALFNYAMGLPILFATEWTYELVYTENITREPMALSLWADFGIMVILIGYGYQIISRDVTKNRGIVLLGIFAKLFDVVTLSYRYVSEIANAIVLIPAFIDGVFVLFFIIFWLRTRTQ